MLLREMKRLALGNTGFQRYSILKINKHKR